MTEITFVRTAWHYQTYDDFFRLAELSGYPIIPLSELNPADDSKTYIITPLNGEWSAGWDNPCATIIHWDLEWRHKTDYPHNIPGVVETWGSDSWYAMTRGLRYVTLGSHPDLPSKPPVVNPAPFYDVAFLAYMNPRRQRIADELVKLGIRIAPNAWEPERWGVLTNVRAIVHVHQWEEFKCMAPQRWAVAAAYKLPIISESVYSAPERNLGEDVVWWGGYTNLANVIAERLHRSNLDWTLSYGRRLYDYLCIDRPFRHNVDAAVEALERFGVV